MIPTPDNLLPSPAWDSFRPKPPGPQTPPAQLAWDSFRPRPPGPVLGGEMRISDALGRDQAQNVDGRRSL